MIELMKALYTQINSAHTYSTYRHQAPQGAPYPYAVYKLLPVQNTEKDRDDYTLEVSCWGLDDVDVMQMSDAIRQSLIHFRHLDEHNLIVVSRPNVGYIPDPDPSIKRYDVTATLLTYRRS